ncbi:uncharacterized protein LOC124274452, partial [Haliotis rubra]|uniref:uncharacterized protein LOC124274452 n=1 Tax=Haliotis rubra TaxID=36100 RepID=UPI001EE557F4
MSTGTCLKGCSPGWVSDTCQQANRQSPSLSLRKWCGRWWRGWWSCCCSCDCCQYCSSFLYRRKRNSNKKRSDTSVYEDVSAFEPTQEQELQEAAPSVNAGYEEEAVRDADGSGKNTA